MMAAQKTHHASTMLSSSRRGSTISAGLLVRMGLLILAVGFVCEKTTNQVAYIATDPTTTATAASAMAALTA